MTAKEKASQLINDFYDITYYSANDYDERFRIAKQCALIAVDEILHELDHTPILDDDYCEWKMNYWQQVKQEIEKL